MASLGYLLLTIPLPTAIATIRWDLGPMAVPSSTDVVARRMSRAT